MRGHMVDVIYLDFQKSIDNVPHQRLIGPTQLKATDELIIFSCLKFRFCVTTVSNIMIIKYYCQLVQWYSMRLVCIAGYCLHFSVKVTWYGKQHNQLDRAMAN